MQIRIRLQTRIFILIFFLFFSFREAAPFESAMLLLLMGAGDEHGRLVLRQCLRERMVVIQVKCECGECCREWVLLDLQGEITLPQSESLSGITLGSFCKDGPVSPV